MKHIAVCPEWFVPQPVRKHVLDQRDFDTASGETFKLLECLPICSEEGTRPPVTFSSPPSFVELLPGFFLLSEKKSPVMAGIRRNLSCGWYVDPLIY